jgi:UDP-MurNAc hydroxylase
MTVRFEVAGPGGGRWDATFAPGGARVDLKGRAASVNYRFAVGGRWLVPVVDGRAGWEDLLLSLRVSAWRDPDVYNDYLIGLLKHADARVLRAVEAYETAEREHETVVIEANGSRYEVSRYCPHAGEDLALGAVVVDGVLRCLGHNYEFDLETGACVNARCQPIKSHCLETLGSL